MFRPTGRRLLHRGILILLIFNYFCVLCSIRCEAILGKTIMDRSDVKELYLITPIVNVPSIMEYGILSYNLSMKLPHLSVAMQEIQDKRRRKKIPGTKKKLHDYANLYFDPHNPMLSKRRDQNAEICVLRINPEVIDLPEVIIADRNASSDYVRFYPVEEGLAAIDENKLFARYWTHSENEYEEWAHKSVKCAEVLVPDKVDPKYILGAYIANQTALDALKKLRMGLTVCIKSDIFF